MALGGARRGWIDYETALAAAPPPFDRPDLAEGDLLTINYTSGTTSRPKGVMITHRNAYLNVVGTLIHHPMTVRDRYLWTLPMFHANGWTFVWIVTAVGGTHVCLRKVDPVAGLRPDRAGADHHPLCGPDRADRPGQRARGGRGDGPRAGVRVLTAGAPPAAATIERIEGELGWTITQVYGLTETAPFITICEPRPEHARSRSSERADDQGAPGRRAGHLGRAPGGGRAGPRGPAGRRHARRDRRARATW